MEMLLLYSELFIVLLRMNLSSLNVLLGCIQFEFITLNIDRLNLNVRGELNDEEISDSG